MAPKKGNGMKGINVQVSLYFTGLMTAAGISFSLNGFSWLTIGNALLSWSYVACKIWQLVGLHHSI